LDVKIADFAFSAPIGQTAFGTYRVSPAYPHLNYCAPEIFSDGEMGEGSDVYAWGATIASAFKKSSLFNATTIDDQISELQEIILPQFPTDDFRSLVAVSLSFDPALRPTIALIIQSKSFLQLSLRSLAFIDVILTKTDADRFTFYSNLLPSLSLFSNRMLRYKMEPLFLSEIQRDVRFAPPLIPLIFAIGRTFHRADFLNEIVAPLTPILQMASPENLALANFSVASIIVDRLDSTRQSAVLFPLFMSSLQSSSARLRTEALRKIPLLIAGMAIDSIMSSVLPALVALVEQGQETSVICAIVESLAQLLVKVDHNTFCGAVCPKILLCWHRIPTPELASAVEILLAGLRPEPPAVCKFVVPLVAEVLGARRADHDVQARLADAIARAVDSVVVHRGLEQRARTWQSPPPEAELAMPVKAVRIDFARQVFAPAPRASDPARHAPATKSPTLGDTIEAEVPVRAGREDAVVTRGSLTIQEIPMKTPPARIGLGGPDMSASPPAKKAVPSMFSGMQLGAPKKKASAASSSFV
jgi:hypothetical protein